MDVLDEGVEFVTAALLLVSLSRDSDADSPGEVPNSLAPQELVKFGIDPNIGSPHHLGDQLLDSLDRRGSFALELYAVGQLVHVDGRVDGGLGYHLSLLFLHHNATN